MPLTIRPSSDADVAAITAIYEHNVLHGTGTFEEDPQDAAEVVVVDELDRVAAHEVARRPAGEVAHRRADPLDHHLRRREGRDVREPLLETGQQPGDDVIHVRRP